MKMLKYGIISEVNYKKGEARVNFVDQEIVSDWLPLPGSMNTVRHYPVNALVAVVMHDNGEDGIIHSRSIIDSEQAPEWANENTEGYQFKDGTSVYYDSSSKELTIDAGDTGELVFNCRKLTVSGDVVAGIGKISLTDHIHTSPVGPTGKPIPTP
jgi:phage baseplate assembly protein gpV